MLWNINFNLFNCLKVTHYNQEIRDHKKLSKLIFFFIFNLINIVRIFNGVYPNVCDITKVSFSSEKLISKITINLKKNHITEKYGLANSPHNIPHYLFLILLNYDFYLFQFFLYFSVIWFLWINCKNFLF